MRPIAVFDSGVGGISVLRALVKELPGEDFVYFGDSAHAPYGPRTTEEIRALTLENLRRLDETWHFKAAVIACNTATSAAIHELRLRYPDRPMIGIEPALKLAADRHPGGNILVMATETTLREEKFAVLAETVAQSCRVFRLPCPGLVELVERGEADSPETEACLRRLLAPCLQPAPDAVVLGCTHYPFAANALRRILNPATELLDGSEGTARQTRRLLKASGLLREAPEGRVTLLNSSPDPAMLELSRKLLEGTEDKGQVTSDKGQVRIEN